MSIEAFIIYGIAILGLGFYLGDEIYDNHELDTNDKIGQSLVAFIFFISVAHLVVSLL